MQPFRRQLSLALLSLPLCGALAATPSGALAFPTRPVTLIVPTPAGGPSDSSARMVAKALSAAWGQPVVVENRAGANGAIAAKAAMGAAPDGHTLLWASASMAGLPFVMKNPPYKSMSELTAVSGAVQFGYALFVNRDLPVQNFAELVAYGRARPGQLSYATGVLTEYGMALHVLNGAGVKAERVPYKGGAQLMPDLIAGQVQLNFGPIISGLQHVRAGKLKMLATTLPQRSALLPDVPTLNELGVPSGGLPSWNAIFAPPGTPREVAEKIAAAVAAALRDPTVQGPLVQSGVEPAPASPQQLADTVSMTSAAWKTFVRDHDIPME